MTRQTVCTTLAAACLALPTVAAAQETGATAQQPVPSAAQQPAPSAAKQTTHLAIQDSAQQPSSSSDYHYESGWSLNLTPVLLLAHGDYRFGGGGDPELKYTADVGRVRLSAGARAGVYYAKNLFGVTAMPTLRVAMPSGNLEPYVAFGMGYGWLPDVKHSDLASMSRVGFVYHFSQRFALGLEGTFQKIDNSDFSFPSVGSMASFDF
jgi:hypothetical protein